MSKPKKDKKKPNVKLSQKQKQSVVVNVLLAKSRAPRRPSGKKALPVFQPSIRMIVSGDIMNREPPRNQLLGEDIRKLIQLEVKNPIAELRQDFLSRIESRPRTEIIGKPFTDEMERIRKADEDVSPDRTVDMFNTGGSVQSDITSNLFDERLFEPRFVDGASIEMLMSGDYGFTRTGRPRTEPTKKQRDAMNKNKSV